MGKPLSFYARLALSAAAKKPVFSDVLHEIPQRDKALVFAVMKQLSQKTEHLVFYDRETVLNISAEVGKAINAVFSSPFQLAGLLAQKINYILSQGGFSVFDLDDENLCVYRKPGIPEISGRNNSVVSNYAEEPWEKIPLPPERGVQQNSFEDLNGRLKKRVGRPSIKTQEKKLEKACLNPDEVNKYLEDFRSMVLSVRKLTPLSRIHVGLIELWLKITGEKLKIILEHLIEQGILKDVGGDLFQILIPEKVDA